MRGRDEQAKVKVSNVALIAAQRGGAPAGTGSDARQSAPAEAPRRSEQGKAGALTRPPHTGLGMTSASRTKTMSQVACAFISAPQRSPVNALPQALAASARAGASCKDVICSRGEGQLGGVLCRTVAQLLRAQRTQREQVRPVR